jgi:hypothetical protein
MERSLGVFFLIQKCYLEAGPREVGAAQGVEVPLNSVRTNFCTPSKGKFRSGRLYFCNDQNVRYVTMS